MSVYNNLISKVPKPPLVQVYSRMGPQSSAKSSFFDLLSNRLVEKEEEDKVDEVEPLEADKEDDEAHRMKKRREDLKKKKKKWLRPVKKEPVSLYGDTTALRVQNGDKGGNAKNVGWKRKRVTLENRSKVDETVDPTAKKWVRLSFDGVDPEKFIGLQSKVYWPLDDDWYDGQIVGYNAETGRHQVSYGDGDKENVTLSIEKIKFHVSPNEMQQLNLKYSTAAIADDLNFSEMEALAAHFDDDHDPGRGDIIWAKLSGHAVWPAVIVDESVLVGRKGLNRTSEGKSVPVQFFGTHDFARVNAKQVISFLKGLHSCFHLKCKKTNFLQSLEEARTYLSEQHLPERMLRMQTGEQTDNNVFSDQDDEENASFGEDCIRDKEMHRNLDKELSHTKRSLKSSSGKWMSQISHKPHEPFQIKWNDLDKCNVCNMDEEYEDNLFLQCDKCRMMVHAKCYGELEPIDGVLWLCNLCRPGAPEYSPPCCLCPVRGGAMKPTTDGRWAHLACAIWIPETCLSDIKKMEPIDGLSRINKDRWKLLCSICRVPYGACIQCSNNTCRVAYHPLCARIEGFYIELADEDKLHNIDIDGDEDQQCIQLHSFCKKHIPPSRDRLNPENRILPSTQQDSENVPPTNPSGCARSEPFNFLSRRGRKEPDALAAASLKRLFVENKPYLVRGYEVSFNFRNPVKSPLDVQNNIHSMIEKFRYMKTTFRKRLAFGKSGIHGFGIFAKQPHRAGDMVIEYTGELVRPSIADRRERLIYDSLVGAGTYMFRIDNERVIDATRAGSIAHLINHSCEPNCYSRVITVNGDEHIIIFAKRDIKQWEELTYDYRFMSIDEQLPCYCGHTRCRGVVNDIESEELVSKQLVPCSELTELKEE